MRLRISISFTSAKKKKHAKHNIHIHFKPSLLEQTYTHT